MIESKKDPENLIWEQFVCSQEISSEDLLKIEQAIPNLPESFALPFHSFILAMRGISDAVCLPFTFSMRQSFQLHQRVSHIKLIHKHEKLGPLPNETRDETINRIATSAKKELSIMKEDWVNNQKLTDRILKEISANLLFNINGKPNDEGAKEIRYQALVSIWSALEVLLKDELILIFNEFPTLTKQLLEHEQAKKHFSIPKLDLDVLESYSFDLNGKMGDLIFKSRDVSDLVALKYAIKALFGNSDIYNILNDEDIRLLNLQRHLIVHKRGICDEKYSSSTTGKTVLGEKITVPPASLIKYFQKVSNAGLFMLKAIQGITNS